MKKILQLLVMMLITIPCFSQINFEKGYFINNQGIKTECLIRNPGWKDNPTSFEYKINENEEPRKPTITEVTEFSVESYKYKRFTVNIDRSGVLYNDLSSNKAPEWSEETVFLKTLVEGEITLYMFSDNKLTRFFFSIAPHEKAEQLVYKEYIAKDDSYHSTKNNYFRQQLFNILKSPTLSMSDFKNIEYRKDDIVKVFIKYNNSEDKKFTDFKDKTTKTSFNLKVIAGIALGNLNYEIPNSVPLTLGAKAKNTSFKIGLEAEIILPINQNKWSFFLSPNYQSFKSEVNIRQGSMSPWNIKLDYNVLELPLGLRHYMFLNTKSRIFIDAGYTIGITMNSTADYKRGAEKLKNKISTAGNIFIGAGYSYSDYSLEMRYNPKRELLPDYQLYSIGYSGLNFIAAYKFL